MILCWVCKRSDKARLKGGLKLQKLNLSIIFMKNFVNSETSYVL